MTPPGSKGPRFLGFSKDSQGEGMTINVEYNQLDPLLKTTPAGGDVADSTGFSPYPGQRRPMASHISGSCVAKGKRGGEVGKKLAIMR